MTDYLQFDSIKIYIYVIKDWLFTIWFNQKIYIYIYILVKGKRIIRFVLTA